VKTTSKILGVLNSSPSEVKSLLNRNGVDFKLILNHDYKVEEIDDTVYGFTNSDTLINNLKSLKRTPFLWESACVFKHMSLTQPVVLIDAKVLNDGVIIFEDLKKAKIKHYLKKTFKPLDVYPYLNRRPVKQWGNNSKMSKLINNLLVSFPSFVYEPTIISLTTAFETNNYKIFSEFLSMNRLITNENKSDYLMLVNYIKELRAKIIVISSGTKKEKLFLQNDLKKLKDIETKESLKRVKFLLTYFGTKDINVYLDSENIVNSDSTCAEIR